MVCVYLYPGNVIHTLFSIPADWSIISVLQYLWNTLITQHKIRRTYWSISSDSDDCAPYVPLAQRLEQRRRKAISPSSSSSSSSYAAAGNGEDGVRCPPSNLPRPNGPSGSDWLLGLRQARTASRGASPVRRKPAGRGQQKDKEERERQKAERKALAEAAKALRPEECIKRMVVAVDPGL